MFSFFLNKNDNDSKSLKNIIKVLLETGFDISNEILFFCSVGVVMLLIKV